ncbi:MAG: hypothetical protein HY556_12285 [Euryarchaeota archaeon]|nr:hypothetical protein [Euryarchaeota archaeon]
MLRRSGVRKIIEACKTKKDYQITEEAAIRATRIAEAIINAFGEKAWKNLDWSNSALQNNGFRKRFREGDADAGLVNFLDDPEARESLKRELGL